MVLALLICNTISIWRIYQVRSKKEFELQNPHCGQSLLQTSHRSASQSSRTRCLRRPSHWWRRSWVLQTPSLMVGLEQARLRWTLGLTCTRSLIRKRPMRSWSGPHPWRFVLRSNLGMRTELLMSYIFFVVIRKSDGKGICLKCTYECCVKNMWLGCMVALCKIWSTMSVSARYRAW